MYFANFPNIYYEYTINGVTHLKIVKDITANIRFIKEVVENITSYDEYDILDGETPEQIAANVYGNSLYHWVIMIVNDRYDYREDFPLDYTALNKRVDASTEIKLKPYTIGNMLLRMVKHT